MPARLGVDIGGTFTDLVVIDEATGTARVGKVLTTPKDPAHGVEEGIRALLDDAAGDPARARPAAHGRRPRPTPRTRRKAAKPPPRRPKGSATPRRSGAEAATNRTIPSTAPPP